MDRRGGFSSESLRLNRVFLGFLIVRFLVFPGGVGSCAEIRSLGLTPRSLSLPRVSVFVA
jgi:hypothetical protein